MASEFVAALQPADLQRESSMGHEPGLQLVAAPGGDLRGASLPKLASQGYTCGLVIPGSLTMGTGLTFKLPITDDGSDAADLGKVVRLGVTVKLIASGADTEDLDAAAGAEQTVDVTLDSNSGEVVIGSLAIAAANLDSAVVGSLIAVRVRRVATASQDTCNGRVVLLGVYIFNT